MDKEAIFTRDRLTIASRWLGRVLSLLLVLCVGGVPGASSIEAAFGKGPAETAGITVLRATPEGMTLVLNTPTFQTQPSSDDLGPCVKLSVAGYSVLDSPWQPQLPVKGALVGIPPEGEVVLRVVDQEWEVLERAERPCRVTPPSVEGPVTPGELLPAWHPPAPGVDAGLGGWFPGQPAVLKGTGFIRSQRVAQLAFYPLQYDAASGRLWHIQRMVVEVRFTTLDQPGGALSGSRQRESGGFESLLAGLLLNYEQARPWRAGDPIKRPDKMAVATGAGNSAPRYRVIVKESGLYALPYAMLAAADPTVDLTVMPTSTLRMSNRGQDVAIEVVGDTDGVLGPGDTILFYGEAIASKYTDENVYWLTWGDDPGRRMATRNGAPVVNYPVSNWYTDTLHMEVNFWYYHDVAPGDTDHWYWDQLAKGTDKYPDSADYDFELTAVADAPISATVRGLLRGYDASPYHSAEISLNSHTIYTTTYRPGSVSRFTVTVPLTYFFSGTTVLCLKVGTGADKDHTFSNWFEIQYPRRFVAEGDRLTFAAEGGPWTYVVSGFLTNTVDILDITDPWQPVRVSHATVSGASGAYTVTFAHPTSSPHRYLLRAWSQRRAPVSVERADPVDLRTVPEGADYIIITHGHFYTAAQPLAAYHAADGLRVLTADVQDVYDTFNDGIVDPAAIQGFLAYAYASYPPPAPAYVLLVGDGNVDPLDYKGWGEPSFIPPYLDDVDPWWGETAADNRYVCVSGDDTLPDMHLGRLPVKTPAEAEALVAKIIAYADPVMSPSGAWANRILFVADNEDDAGDFHALSDAVADHYVPKAYTVWKIYYGTAPYTERVSTRRAITEAINSGVLLVNYVGHGDVNSEYWAGEKLLARGYLGGLTNRGRLPFMVPMTCLDGYYVKPSPSGSDNSALGEAIVRLPTTGAIASWSATGLGLAHGHDYLNRGLFEALFWKDITALGPATTYAKLYLADNTAGYDDLLDTYLLFGDPATRLRPVPVLIYLPLVMRSAP